MTAMLALGCSGFAVAALPGAGAPSANRISLLRDSDGNGLAEVRTALLQGLNSPFGRP